MYLLKVTFPWLITRFYISETVKNATGPLLVEIDKTPGCLLGITLSCISVPEHAIVIESIRQASVAERYINMCYNFILLLNKHFLYIYLFVYFWVLESDSNNFYLKCQIRAFIDVKIDLSRCHFRERLLSCNTYSFLRWNTL